MSDATTEKRDPRLLTTERLAEWRKWATDCDQFIAQDLLAHIDALAAENAELRARAGCRAVTPAERRAAIRYLRALADALEAEERDGGRPAPPPRRRRVAPTAADHARLERALRKAGVEP